MTVQQYSIVAHDWVNLEFIINDLTRNVVGQKISPTSSPTFVGITITDDADIGGNLDIAGNLDLGGTLVLDTLTASRLVATNADKEFVSSDLDSWITGTDNEIAVEDGGDGSIIIKLADVVNLGASL